jgi:preprotein translocase subunit SecF
MDVVGKRFWFFLISALVIIPGIISLAVYGLNWGVEFSSGTTMTLRCDTEVSQEQFRQAMMDLGYREAVIQRTEEGDFFVRIRELSLDERETLLSGLKDKLGTDVTLRDAYSVSPILAAETARNAAIAVLIAAIFMMLYIAWAFRHMPKPLRWGTVAVIALAHDVLVVLGIFSILGWAAGVQVDSLFITGILTVVGYSINNIVVVFDRIRENVSRGISKDFEVTVNSSILETMGRCLNTSLTTLFTIVALLLLGGITLRYFVLVLFIGVVAGTYDSICVAGQLLVVWDKGEWGRFLGLMRPVKRTA